MLQQYLPLAVLKLINISQDSKPSIYLHVATVLTACGIETLQLHMMMRHSLIVATVLTVYGIETRTWNIVLTYSV